MKGVLPSQRIRQAQLDQIIISPVYSFESAQIQPASLDLRLGESAYRLRSSFLPAGRTVEERLENFAMERIDLRDGAVLERNRPYLIPLCERLDLPAGWSGRANPKSSTGRLDVFARLLTDHGEQFDEVRDGYAGPLYCEIVSRSFTIRVQRGLTLSQLRLYEGDPSMSLQRLRALEGEIGPFVYLDGEPAAAHGVGDKPEVFLTLDLKPNGDGGRRHVGWRARKVSGLVDMAAVDRYNIDDYWDPVLCEPGGGLILEPEEFYLLLSRESMVVPSELAAEMEAYDPSSGELRTHYAGFFDPGFGLGGPPNRTGSRAALEVRAHDVPFMVENGQRVCSLSFQELLEPPDVVYGSGGSHYQFQEQTVGKHFKRASAIASP